LFAQPLAHHSTDVFEVVDAHVPNVTAAITYVPGVPLADPAWRSW